MSLLKEFISFLKKPELSEPVSLSYKQTVIVLIKSIPVYFLFVLICTILFIPLSVFNLIPEIPARSLADTFDLIVIAPILEELFFRLSLRNFFRNIFVPISLLFYALTKSFLGIYLTIAISIFLILSPYIPGFINRIEQRVNKEIKKFYFLFFYIIALSFGFLHITNFDNLTTSQYFVGPVIVLYQILLGLYLGFLRVKFKYGILYSILVHSIFNSIPILIKLL